MENTASELMRNYVNSQNFSSTGEIMEAMKVKKLAFRYCPTKVSGYQ